MNWTGDLARVAVVISSVMLSCLQVRSRENTSAEFLAEGSVTYQNFVAEEQMKLRTTSFPLVVTNSQRFSIVVSNSCYLVRLTPTIGKSICYQEAAFDGHTLYYLTSFIPPEPRAERGAAKTGGNVATAWVYDQQRIVYSSFAHEMGIVWLMLASGDYFRSLTNSLAEPALTIGLFENMEFYPRPFKVPVKWLLQESFPFLPLQVSYFDDGETKTAPPFKNAKRNPPFDLGFTNLVFTVTSTQEFDGISVPSVAEVVTYIPSPFGRTELVPYTKYRATLNTFARGIPPSVFRPKLPGATVISDARVLRATARGVGPVTRWPTD